MKIRVITEYPIALDSPDHTHPWGVNRDNTTSAVFIEYCENYFNRKISFLDLGCAGGQLAIDFFNRGNIGVGLEGSDRLVGAHGNWKDDHYNVCLFTCDISRKFEIIDQELNSRILFDVISAWEVLEHIHPERLDILMENIDNHLKPEGWFAGSISTNSDGSSGVELHQSIFTQEKWYEILEKKFNVEEWQGNKVRECAGSFYVKLTKK